MPCEGSVEFCFEDRGIQPMIGVLCCNETLDRPVQTVATRFIRPLREFARAIVVLVPSIADGDDAAAIANRLDGLLLTGSRSHVAPQRYGGTSSATPLDVDRDAVALALADRMIERGRPVFGICRGMQEINVLFGGSLTDRLSPGVHHGGEQPGAYATMFTHRHPVDIVPGGLLDAVSTGHRIDVNSVHFQGIDRLGGGLAIEATAEDGLIEAISARPLGADVLAVQWHPEWDVTESTASRRFFHRIGVALREAA